MSRRHSSFAIFLVTSLCTSLALAVNNEAVISGGVGHTCAVTTSGGVKCWGLNDSGQLGDSSTSRRLTPVDVSGLTGGVNAIAAGADHTCALTTSGGIKCWGLNSYGQLGDNSSAPRTTPRDVLGLSARVKAIATGSSHTCALTTSGGVKCWGLNDHGQLGNNTNAPRLTPADVSGLTTGVEAIAAGSSHTCALTTSGGVKCWGLNDHGQLGNNSNTPRLTPGDVSSLTRGVTAITLGASHTCALTASRGVKCWGLNDNGQLGDNANTPRLTAGDVSGLTSGVQAIAAGSYHTCALTTSGGLKCWGRNSSGQLGDNSNIDRRVPYSVPGLASGVTAVGMGESHTCAVSLSGGVKCWGGNDSGQLGDNSNARRLSPWDVLGISAGGVSLTIAAGWNLVGDSVQAPIDVAEYFNDASKVASIWKWVTTGTAVGVSYPTWAFYSPGQTDGGQTYAASKGYDFLVTINEGEGFWVHAAAAFTVQLPVGSAVASASFQSMSSGWHLISTGNSQSPSDFSATVAATPSAAGTLPLNVKSLWAWDNARSKWYFYAPSLDSKRGSALADFISGGGYLNFTTANKTLGPGGGFWVNVQ